MSALATRQAIADELKLYTGAPKIFAENIAIPNADAAGEWVRWAIRMADTFDSSVGAEFERSLGTLYFQHFQPETQGTKEAFAFCDKVGGMLNRKASPFAGGVLIWGRAVCKWAGVTDGKVQHNVTIDFREEAAALNA